MEVTIKRFNLDSLCEVNFFHFLMRCIENSTVGEFGGRINPAKVRKVVLDHCSEENKVLLVAMIGEQYVGILAAEYAPFRFTDTLVGSEVFFRVDSEFRGNGIGKKLIKEFSLWCQEKGVKFLQMGVAVHASENYQLAIAAYKADGFKDFHFSFFKEV